MFPVTSRYYGIEIAQLEVSEDRILPYLRRRFLPIALQNTLVTEHVVVQGDRLDNITARYLADPEQFWRVCDSNNAQQPEELTSEIGRALCILLPQGG